MIYFLKIRKEILNLLPVNLLKVKEVKLKELEELIQANLKKFKQLTELEDKTKFLGEYFN